MRYLGLVLLAALVIGIFGFRLQPVSAQSPGAENPCPYTVRINGATSSAVLIPHSGNAIRICFYSLALGLNATTTAQLVWGTGSACGSNAVDSSPLLQFGSAVTANDVAITAGDGYGFIDEGPSRGVSDYCIVVSGSGPRAYGTIKYGLY